MFFVGELNLWSMYPLLVFWFAGQESRGFKNIRNTTFGGNSAIRAAEHDHDIMMQNRHRFRAMATNLFQPLGDSNGSSSWTMMRYYRFLL